MWLNQSSKYSYLNLEPVKKIDLQLEKDLNELKTEIEANEMVYGIKLKRPNTSIQAPKDAKNERKLYIERMLQVNGFYILFFDYYYYFISIRCMIRDPYLFKLIYLKNKLKMQLNMSIN